jgi:hypothetical protein
MEDGGRVTVACGNDGALCLPDVDGPLQHGGHGLDLEAAGWRVKPRHTPTPAGGVKRTSGCPPHAAVSRMVRQ